MGQCRGGAGRHHCVRSHVVGQEETEGVMTRPNKHEVQTGCLIEFLKFVGKIINLFFVPVVICTGAVEMQSW